MPEYTPIMRQRYQALMDRLGKNWVIARRTKRIVKKYGDDVTCLSLKRYEAIVKEIETLIPSRREGESL